MIFIEISLRFILLVVVMIIFGLFIMGCEWMCRWYYHRRVKPEIKQIIWECQLWPESLKEDK